MAMTSRLRIWASALLLCMLLATMMPLSWAKPTVLREVPVAHLPPEARATLVQIKQGGPFLYAKDGSVFGNREQRLPFQARGYYREYTVPTPGARNRGARRIVAGSVPAGEFYYTADHYRSFQRIKE